MKELNDPQYCENCGLPLIYVKHIEPDGFDGSDESYYECPDGCEDPTESVSITQKPLTTVEKMEALNKECKNTLGLTHFELWEIHSYGDDTPLNMKVKYPYIKAKTIKEVVDLAYQFVFTK